ncbi:MAG: HNH nuclease family protein [Magnetococcales bacterium]|nr:HNH nuclease family protein [Magnetococcales bacterium]
MKSTLRRPITTGRHKRTITSDRVDAIVSTAQQAQGYREQSLRIHPWVCGRCGRAFTMDNLYELTIHHKDHNHSNNPTDGSNWEHLCIYCHDQEHEKHERAAAQGHVADLSEPPPPLATHNPFADLKALLQRDSN